MSKRTPTATKRQRRAPAPPSLDQQRWDAVRADRHLQRMIRLFLVERSRSALATPDVAWATTPEVLARVGHLDTLQAYVRVRQAPIPALVQVLKDMEKLGYIDSGKRVGGIVTGGSEANVWRARLSTLHGFKYVLHVANGKVRRLRGDHHDPMEIVGNPAVPANIYDIHDGEIVYENVTIYGPCATGTIARDSADHRAILDWLRIVEGGGEG